MYDAPSSRRRGLPLLNVVRALDRSITVIEFVVCDSDNWTGVLAALQTFELLVSLSLIKCKLAD